MDYLRQTVDSDKLTGVFDLPDVLRGRKVDVIILPVQETYTLPKKRGAFGCLRQFANPSLMDAEGDAWERAVAEKYANR
ncbi:MAG: hypothetical protein LBK56_08595 [Gracilibacteraceae bacterium]|jgi:hypothetical protein|nr:hypothetical protein [Gracilibacteraceae bacterium]